MGKSRKHGVVANAESTSEVVPPISRGIATAALRAAFAADGREGKDDLKPEVVDFLVASGAGLLSHPTRTPTRVALQDLLGSILASIWPADRLHGLCDVAWGAACRAATKQAPALAEQRASKVAELQEVVEQASKHLAEENAKELLAEEDKEQQRTEKRRAKAEARKASPRPQAKLKAGAAADPEQEDHRSARSMTEDSASVKDDGAHYVVEVYTQAAQTNYSVVMKNDGRITEMTKLGQEERSKGTSKKGTGSSALSAHISASLSCSTSEDANDNDSSILGATADGKSGPQNGLSPVTELEQGPVTSDSRSCSDFDLQEDLAESEFAQLSVAAAAPDSQEPSRLPPRPSGPQHRCIPSNAVYERPGLPQDDLPKAEAEESMASSGSGSPGPFGHVLSRQVLSNISSSIELEPPFGVAFRDLGVCHRTPEAAHSPLYVQPSTQHTPLWPRTPDIWSPALAQSQLPTTAPLFGPDPFDAPLFGLDPFSVGHAPIEAFATVRDARRAPRSSGSSSCSGPPRSPLLDVHSQPSPSPPGLGFTDEEFALPLLMPPPVLQSAPHVVFVPVPVEHCSKCGTASPSDLQPWSPANGSPAPWWMAQASANLAKRAEGGSA